MGLDELMAAARTFFSKGFAGVIRVEVTDRSQSFWVDGREREPLVQAGSPPGVAGGFCLWRAEGLTLERLFTNEQRRLESAFISSRLKISGDMSVMARLEVGNG
ncbi:SCP2 sterol-binding domain-containing protein [Parvularcula dongshanensis]|uniref:SCP2 domain-containing protein n=1 Tax=Parvularcula dongshanensis TaxID=1173995 RepID=A0A840HZQ4_9PROT|nr:SCP2 sterol-binding domain-containing protein [Parvularcula dongshanensis]MBB4657585.1 hypothetical protein [Parvularcula dongshanensis]